MSACFQGNTLAQGIELIPLLLKTVEKAVAQSAQVCFYVVIVYSYGSAVKDVYDGEVGVMLIVIL
jgi:hypothetical protein